MSGPTGSISRPKLERTAFAGRQRQVRLLLGLAMQGALLLVVLAASAFADGRARLLYLWAASVPLGFALVYVLAYRRGERARSDGSWTPDWEKRDAKRNYALLGVVGLVWVAGSFAILSLT